MSLSWDGPSLEPLFTDDEVHVVQHNKKLFYACIQEDIRLENTQFIRNLSPQGQPKELKDDVNCEFPFQKDTDISAL